MEGQDYAGLIVELRQDEWHYIMPGVNSMKAFGPFSSDEMAIEHLRRFHPNPETWRQLYLAQGQTAMDLTEHPLLAKWIQTSSFEINRE